MRSHWVSNDVKYYPVLPSRRVPRSLHGVSASNTTSLTTKGQTCRSLRNPRMSGQGRSCKQTAIR